MQHLWKKLDGQPKDWRRKFKALHVLEYLIKNGAPRCIQEIKDELFKIRSLQDFSYSDNGTERGAGLRDKARSICELLSDSQKLEEEREFCRKNKDKFGGEGTTGSY
jgi:epsin